MSNPLYPGHAPDDYDDEFNLTKGNIKMPYKCAYGCTSFNPACDACDSEIEGNEWEDKEADEEMNHKAACKGLTREEYDEQEGEE